jgi:hypothetical protein
MFLPDLLFTLYDLNEMILAFILPLVNIICYLQVLDIYIVVK